MTVTQRKPSRPRNQLGQPATKTTEETVTRLEEKLFRNRGAANRARIAGRISEERTTVR